MWNSNRLYKPTSISVIYFTLLCMVLYFRITLLWKRKTPNTCPTRLGGMQRRDSARRSVPSLRDSQTRWWCTGVTMPRNSWLSGLLSMPLKSSTSSLERYFSIFYSPFVLVNSVMSYLLSPLKKKKNLVRKGYLLTYHKIIKQI